MSDVPTTCWSGSKRTWPLAQRKALLAELKGAKRGDCDLDRKVMNALGRKGTARLTTSIDAAETVVPPDHSWYVSSDGYACVTFQRRRSAWAERAADPALALCISALRARWAAEEGL